MKALYNIMILAAAVSLMSCGSKPDRPAPALDQNRTVQDPVQPSISTAPTGTGGTVHHYICPNNCAGSGGPDATGVCPTCGAQYVHNQAWHNQPGQQTTTTPGIQTQTTTSPEPAQNAAGVWHYICPSGHEGGAGSAVACAVCGATLVHNTAYHN